VCQGIRLDILQQNALNSETKSLNTYVKSFHLMLSKCAGEVYCDKMARTTITLSYILRLYGTLSSRSRNLYAEHVDFNWIEECQFIETSV
jgi:hypothetical protein